MKPEEIDNLFRENIANMGGVPPRVTSWDPDKAFGKIQQGVKKSGGRISLNAVPLFTLLWNARAAAIVTLVSGLGLVMWKLELPEPSVQGGVNIRKSTLAQSSVGASTLLSEREINAPASMIGMESEEICSTENASDLGSATSGKTTSSALGTKEESMDVASLPTLEHKRETQKQRIDWTGVASQEVAQALVVTSHYGISRTLKPQVSFASAPQKAQTGLSVSAPMGIGLVNGKPSCQTGILLERFAVAEGLNYSAVGAQVNWLVGGRNEGRATLGNALQPALFATLETGKMSKTKKWTVGLGYLIGARGNQLGRKALKLFASKTFGKKVQVSPEIIISERFGRFMPGVTVSI